MCHIVRKEASMITKIGIISGQILEFLEQNNGVIVFGEIHPGIRQPRDLVLMSVGALIHKNYVCVMEDPLRAIYRDAYSTRTKTAEVCMFDLVIRNNADERLSNRIKDVTQHIEAVGTKILTLLEGCGGLLAMQTIECNLKESRDIVLMGLGWLIREGYVKGITSVEEIFIFRMPNEADKLKTEEFAHV
jgi:hypothetical protein